jgi:hypothetical protein
MVSLPAKREYVLGAIWYKARYVLVSANITPHSAESDTLTVKIHFMSECQAGYRSEFSTSQFKLLVDERPIAPERFFSDEIPPGDSRDKDVSFFIDSSVTHAVLRIQVRLDSIEVPLELSVPATPS